MHVCVPGFGLLLGSSLLTCSTLTDTTTGPLGTPIRASYGVNTSKKLAVIEMATASGLELVPESQRNPMNTTTRGTGELIADAYASGCTKVLLGIGGSATSDGGLGAMQALGLDIYTKDGILTVPACGKVCMALLPMFELGLGRVLARWCPI